MIFYVLETLSEQNKLYVVDQLKRVGKEEDFTVVTCDIDKLNLLAMSRRPALTVDGEIKGVIFYEE